jgi:predicted component of type VI protein secretion system
MSELMWCNAVVRLESLRNSSFYDATWCAHVLACESFAFLGSTASSAPDVSFNH